MSEILEIAGIIVGVISFCIFCICKCVEHNTEKADEEARQKVTYNI